MGASPCVGWLRSPTALELMARRNKAMHSEKSVAYGRAFKTRPTDVFVCTYPKCGTTWMTQICHQLRTGGDMNFEEISEVCPWDILALDCGQDLNADQVASPRVFKSHEKPGDIAQGAKYIHVCRHPEDAFVSFYRFLPAYQAMPDGEITIQEFAEAIFGGVSHSGGIWDYYVDWWQRRGDPNVLWVCFEDLKENLRPEIRRVAEFMGVPLTDELLEIVAKHSSFDFMARETRKFDEHFVFEATRDQVGFPRGYVFGQVEVSKVRAGGGKTGEGKLIPPDVQEMLRQRWRKSVESKTGWKDYAAMREAVHELQRAK